MTATLVSLIADNFKASLPVISIDSPSCEEEAMIETLCKVGIDLGLPVLVYDEVNFLRVPDTVIGQGLSYEKFTEFRPQANPLVEVLLYIREYEGPALFVLVDIHHNLGGDQVNHEAVRFIKTLAMELTRSRKRLVILGQDMALHSSLEGLVTELTNQLPDGDTIGQCVDQALSDLVEDFDRPGFAITLTNPERQRLYQSCQGLTQFEISRALRLAAVSDGVIDSATAERIASQKITKLRKLNVEFCGKPQVEAAGLDLLKAWINRKGKRFHTPDPLRPAPKGMMLVGVPGSGKSLIAQTIGTLWNVPVLSVDMGSIYGSLVGESEANLRRLLSTAEAIAPCVLFLDEIEKALAGVNSPGDSGVSQRLFGKLLTWMQEKTAPVFVLATANNIAGLPPEFTRKGRFDEIFFVDLPNPLERKAILEAHLSRYGVAGVDITHILAATEGFSGAELAAVVEEALDLMDEDGQTTLTPDYLQAAIKATCPLSERNPEALANLRDWAKVSARPATQRLESPTKPAKQGKVVMLG